MALGSNIKVDKSIEAANERDTSGIDTEVAIVNDELMYFDDNEIDDEYAIEEIVEKTTLVVFSANDISYALSIDLIKEIVRLPAVISLPQLNERFIGAANIRGNVYTVVDLSLGTNDQDKVQANKSYAIVIRDEEYKIALKVNEMPHTIHVPVDEVEDPSNLVLQGIDYSQYITGVIKNGERLVLTLDLMNLVSHLN